MTSLTSTPQGDVPGCRQGRSRAATSYHWPSRVASETAGRLGTSRILPFPATQDALLTADQPSSKGACATKLRQGLPFAFGGSRRAARVHRRDRHMGRTPYRLPDTLTASLERAFAGEVAERLPRLLAAAGRLSERDAAGQVVSDAHALASSAAVVGADAAAYAARECEQLLTPYAGDQPVPADIADRAVEAADTMRAA